MQTRIPNKPNAGNLVIVVHRNRNRQSTDTNVICLIQNTAELSTFEESRKQVIGPILFSYRANVCTVALYKTMLAKIGQGVYGFNTDYQHRTAILAVPRTYIA